MRVSRAPVKYGPAPARTSGWFTYCQGMTTAARGHQAPDDEQARRPGVRIARVVGIPVYVAPSWFLIAVIITAIVARPFLGTRPLLGIGIGIAQALVLLVSVLVYDAAHAATAR